MARPATAACRWRATRARPTRPGAPRASARRRGSDPGGHKGDIQVKLSTKGRYAVMALCDLASHAEGRPVALADIAERQEISLSYLEQLFAKLRRGGLVRSVRGPGGGYLPARPLEDTRISDIILAVNEP